MKVEVWKNRADGTIVLKAIGHRSLMSGFTLLGTCSLTPLIGPDGREVPEED